jgi:hypothetical protein
MKTDDTETHEDNAQEDEGDSVERVVMPKEYKPMHWKHYLWVIPLCVAFSPIGVIVILHTDYREYWMIPLAGMMLAICASAAEGSPDEPF